MEEGTPMRQMENHTNLLINQVGGLGQRIKQMEEALEILLRGSRQAVQDAFMTLKASA